MEENKLKVEQEVIKNTTVTEVVFWISTLYNLVTVLLTIFFIIFPMNIHHPLGVARLSTFFIAVPMCVISVPVSAISFYRLINFKKISWHTHKNIFVIFFIGTISAALLLLTFLFGTL